MSYFEDPAGNRHRLFGEGGGQKIADFAGAQLLGQLPLDPRAREWGDAGTPVVQAAPTSEIAKEFISIAEKLADRASVQNSKRMGLDMSIDRSGGTGPVRLNVIR